MCKRKGVVGLRVITEDIDEAADVRPLAARPLGLPEELAEWVNNNQELIQRFEKAQRDSYDTLTEESLWRFIALESGDPEWIRAHDDMVEAEKIWNELNHPINRSLGAIGRALDSDETDKAHDRYLSMLANFTIISEGLIDHRPDLAKLMNVLLVQKRMIDQSLKRAREVVAAAKALTEMFSLKDIFCRVAKKNRIRHQFKSAMERLLAPRKQFNTHVPFPWMPKV